MGMGMVARNDRGVLMATLAGKQHGTYDVAMAEAMGVRWAMQLALELGFRDVMFETNSLTVYNNWSRPGDNRSYLGAAIADCVFMSCYFASFRFMHVRRTGNLAADFMAKYAISYPCFVWIDDYPPGLGGILSSDVASIVFE